MVPGFGVSAECQSIGTYGKKQRACYLAPKNSQLVHILSFCSQGVVSLFIFPTGMIALDSEPHGRRYIKNTRHYRNRRYSRAIHCPASMEKHYVQWFLLKSVQDITVCESCGFLIHLSNRSDSPRLRAPWKKIRQKYGTRQEPSLFKGYPFSCQYGDALCSMVPS